MTPRRATGDDPRFRFIDLFAGIGGVRQAFESAGGECVFTSEWNKFAVQTYAANYGELAHPIAGDITQVDAADVPDHDVLLGGFPCQPFSLAGVSKKNSLGRAHGFSAPTQGTLFFDVPRIIKEKSPSPFLLENVKYLLSHDGGRTFRVVRQTLEGELGYHFQYRVVNGIHWVPQNRQRILIVGFREPTDFDINSLEFPEPDSTVDSILHRTDGTEPRIPHDEDRFFDHHRRRVQERYTLTNNLWAYLQRYALKHQAAGHGFGYGLVKPGMTTRTLSARYYKDGAEILIDQANSNPRRLTPRECARLMGFDDSFVIPVSDVQAYKQFGNSVVVPAIGAVAKAMAPHVISAVANRGRQVA